MAKETTRTSSAKKWTILALIVFLLIVVIGSTYTRYTSTATGAGTAQVAKWAVKINDTDIVSNDSFTVTFNEVANANVVDGKIAPASSLYADFIVDPTGSEVAVDYSFALGTITASAGSVPTGIAVEKVVPVTGATISGTTVTGGTEGSALTADGEGKYTGTIALDSQSAALTSSAAKVIRVYITWTNSDVAADSTSHTTAGNAAPTLTMNITGTAKQHIS